jgi:hypothetical protein
MMSDELVNSERVTIVKGDPVRDFWLDGTVNRYPDYSFKAKVYDVGSIFGIGEGRISKLRVLRKGREVMSYDRDWDEVPKSRRDLKALKEILAGFPEREKETSLIEVVHIERQATRRRFGLFRKWRSTGRRGQPRDDDHER